VFLGKTMTPTGFNPFHDYNIGKALRQCHPSALQKAAQFYPKMIWLTIALFRLLPCGLICPKTLVKPSLEMVTKAMTGNRSDAGTTEWHDFQEALFVRLRRALMGLYPWQR
jgi:hypothetical protein